MLKNIINFNKFRKKMFKKANESLDLIVNLRKRWDCLIKNIVRENTID